VDSASYWRGNTKRAGPAALALSLPRWRKWNLFDRQYRFRPAEDVPLRLGGKRSGGCMGRIDFG
jgi:hypothetical protein